MMGSGGQNRTVINVNQLGEVFSDWFSTRNYALGLSSKVLLISKNSLDGRKEARKFVLPRRWIGQGPDQFQDLFSELLFQERRKPPKSTVLLGGFDFRRFRVNR
jgi:hypothetical protein